MLAKMIVKLQITVKQRLAKRTQEHNPLASLMYRNDKMIQRRLKDPNLTLCSFSETTNCSLHQIIHINVVPFYIETLHIKHS